MTCKFVSREEVWQIEYWYSTTWLTLNMQDCSVAIKWSRLHRWCSKSSDHGLTETPWSTTTSCIGWTCQGTVSTPAAGWLPACKHAVGSLTTRVVIAHRQVLFPFLFITSYWKWQESFSLLWKTPGLCLSPNLSDPQKPEGVKSVSKSRFKVTHSLLNRVLVSKEDNCLTN